MVTGKFSPLENKTLFIVGQDFDTVQDFLHNVLPNPAGTISYTCLMSNSCGLWGLDAPVNYGSGTVHTKAQTELAPDSCLALGLCLKGALEDIVKQKCDDLIDKLGEWIREFKRPVLLRIGYEFDGVWNSYDPQYYKLAFKWIVSRLRFRGVTNFASVWQSATFYSPNDINNPNKAIQPNFVEWFPGSDVVDWMGTSYFDFHRHVHDAFLDFARSKGKPVIIAESAPRTYDLECGVQVDEMTNACRCKGLTGRDIWNAWFKPFFHYIADNRDVIRAVCYINTPWKNQTMWNSGENGYWGDSRIQMDDYIKEQFLREICNSSNWLLSCPDFKSKIDDRV